MENCGWISVEDKLPEDEEMVLCWLCKFGRVEDDNGYHELAWVFNGIWENYQQDDIENSPDGYWVTHWKKIPDRPYSKLELRKLKLENICSNQKK